MSAFELQRNHRTKHCLFSIDSKMDIEHLPTSKKNGSGPLITSGTCCQGSAARCTDGSSYVLNGEDKWTLVREVKNENNSIYIVRGTTLTVNIGVTLANGDAYEAGQDDVLRFCVKKDPDDEAYAIHKELTAANYSDGSFALQLSPSDTKDLEVGRYYYDVGLQVDGEYYMIIEESLFVVQQNISEREV